MKKETRTQLVCTKMLPSGHMEMFAVWVLNGTRDIAKKNYESRGYSATISR